MSNKASYQTAYKLLTLGYSVIPSGGGDKGKAPLVNWRDFQDKPPSEGQLESWENELKPPLWGIVTNGRVAVIDADTQETRAALEAELGEPHVITPRGGAHWYIDTSGHPTKTMVGLLPSIDMRAIGGFANIIGGKYQIKRLPVPGDNLIPWDRLPKRILLALNKPSVKALNGEVTVILEGERNARLTSMAGAMRRKGADRAAIEAALLTINQVQCQTPLPETEVKRIAQSTSGYVPAPVVEKAKDNSENGHHPEFKLLSGIQVEDVKWLWYPYIPYGKLTLLEGDPGVGKSWLTLAIVTALSLGRGFPRSRSPSIRPQPHSKRRGWSC